MSVGQTNTEFMLRAQPGDGVPKTGASRLSGSTADRHAFFHRIHSLSVPMETMQLIQKPKSHNQWNSGESVFTASGLFVYSQGCVYVCV